MHIRITYIKYIYVYIGWLQSHAPLPSVPNPSAWAYGDKAAHQAISKLCCSCFY